MNTAVAPHATVAEPSLEDSQLPVESAQGHSLASDLSELTKARLTTMVLLTTLTGYCLSSRGVFDWTRLGHTLLGTALVAICSSILNQALERDTDALMRRTRVRPFVTRRLALKETSSVSNSGDGTSQADRSWWVGLLPDGACSGAWTAPGPHRSG